jgi:YHS domain-containing protein
MTIHTYHKAIPGLGVLCGISKESRPGGRDLWHHEVGEPEKMSPALFNALIGRDEIMRPTRCLLATIFAATLLLGFLSPPRSEAAVQTKCPVIGGLVNKRVFFDYRGKRVYFCCPPCVREFQKDPEKYMRILEKQGVELEEAPKADKK